MSYAKKALLASAIGYAMDGFDLLILGFMLSAISADLLLSPSQTGSHTILHKKKPKIKVTKIVDRL